MPVSVRISFYILLVGCYITCTAYMRRSLIIEAQNYMLLPDAEMQSFRTEPRKGVAAQSGPRHAAAAVDPSEQFGSRVAVLVTGGNSVGGIYCLVRSIFGGKLKSISSLFASVFNSVVSN